MRFQLVCQAIPIMHDGGHLLAKGKQLVYMRGLCLFEVFESLVAAVLGSGQTFVHRFQLVPIFG
jgi:hypothetical protein